MRHGFLSVFLVLTVCTGLSLPVSAQQARTATLAEGSKVRLALQTQISSKLNEVGDTITAVVYEPVRVEGLLVLPRGTEFEGRITSIKGAGVAQKQAQMTVVFERVILPYGSEPVAVRLTAIDDFASDKKLHANAEGKVKGGHDGKETADNTVRGTKIGGGAAGVIVLSGGSPIAAASVLGSGMLVGLLLSKGREIRLKPGTILRIEFVHPITLPVQDQATGTSKSGASQTNQN